MPRRHSLTVVTEVGHMKDFPTESIFDSVTPSYSKREKQEHSSFKSYIFVYLL